MIHSEAFVDEIFKITSPQLLGSLTYSAWYTSWLLEVAPICEWQSATTQEQSSSMLSQLQVSVLMLAMSGRDS